MVDMQLAKEAAQRLEHITRVLNTTTLQAVHVLVTGNIVYSIAAKSCSSVLQWKLDPSALPFAPHWLPARDGCVKVM